MVVALFYALNSNGTVVGARSSANALSNGLCYIVCVWVRGGGLTYKRGRKVFGQDKSFLIGW